MIKGNLTNPGGSHLSQANFRRFEPYFQDFVSCYPGTLTLEPRDLACVTFAARIRDAANAFITHGFESTLDRNTFQAFWNKSVVTINNGKVIIGPKDSVREAIRANVVKENQGDYFLDLSYPSIAVLNALGILYQNQILTQPSRVQGIDNWVPPVGVVLEPQPDGSFLLL